jgi:hypothetical protein
MERRKRQAHDHRQQHHSSEDEPQCLVHIHGIILTQARRQYDYKYGHGKPEQTSDHCDRAKLFFGCSGQNGTSMEDEPAHRNPGCHEPSASGELIQQHRPNDHAPTVTLPDARVARYSSQL